MIRSIILALSTVVASLLAGCAIRTPNTVLQDALRHQYIAKLDVFSIEPRADRRERFSLRLGGNDVTVRVKPSDVWAEPCAQSDADEARI